MPDDAKAGEEEPTRRRWAVSRTEFATAKLYRSFEQHVRAAQDAFLHGDNSRAEHEATMALRIRPTAHLFALLAVIAESKAQFDRASDFRLLQAFMARDSVLWEELLHDFLSKELYYKSVVCLQRLSALEVRDAKRYRTLQLQLADLLIGLGEIRRATSVLVPLWNSSRCRDFEVFALLASLYFQLGRWASLRRLIESSLQYAFRVTLHGSTSEAKEQQQDVEQVEGKRDVRTGEVVNSTPERSVKEEDADTSQSISAHMEGEMASQERVKQEGESAAVQLPASQEQSKSKRTSKRVRFFGVDDEDKEEEEEDNVQGEEDEKATQGHMSIAQSVLAAEADNTTDLTSSSPLEPDEFDFDEFESELSQGITSTPSSSQQTTTTTTTNSQAGMDAAQVTIHNLYGDTIALHTPQAKRNFLTLVNVHAELLNEEGKMLETVRLLEYAAAALQVDLLELPPDLLVRLGIAYAFLGRHETQCREVFQQLLETCAMDEYGDVLLDAANSLLKVGMYRDAREIFFRIGRYHEFHATSVAQQLTELQQVVDRYTNRPKTGNSVEDDNEEEEANNKAAELQALREEYDALQVILTAAYTGEAQCHYALRTETNNDTNSEERNVREEADPIATVETLLRKALAIDSSHLHARLLLGKLLFYDKSDLSSAIEILTPRPGEPALQRIELGNALVHVFQRAAHYVEAIALGVSIFELILSSAEDGDTQSVAPGSTRRASAAQLSLPTMSRASSAIVPAQSLLAQSGFASETASGSAFVRTGASLLLSSQAGANSKRGSNSVVGGLAASMAASIYASSSLFRQRLRRQGRTATLTSTVYGASAAASIAAGWTNAEEEARSKDSSGIFAFHYTRSSSGRRKSMKRPLRKGEGQAGEDKRPSKRHRRASGGGDEDESVDIAHMQPRQFWERGGSDTERSDEEDTKDNNEEASKETQDKTKARKSKKKKPAVVVAVERGEDDTEADLQALESVALADSTQVTTTTTTTINEDEEDESATYALPSLEEVSRQFDDPAMATLFLQVSSSNPLDSNTDGASSGTAQKASGAQANDTIANTLNNNNVVPDVLADRVTVRDVLAVLGRRELIDLAVTIVDCYSALHKFTEAKEFAFLTLTRVAQKRLSRQLGNTLERPLRLAVLRAALAAGEGEDAYRVGIRLLQENSSEQARCEVIELLHGVLHRAEDRSAILYRLFMEGECDVPLLVLLANRYYQTRSFTRVLNLYLLALQERPQDIFLNFMVALSYYLCSHQKRTRQREACVSAGTVYLARYQSLLIAADPRRTGEAVYNTARALHFLKLYYLCVPLYERVARQLRVPEECSLPVQRAAQLNLYFIYRWNAENKGLALAMLPAA